MNHRKTWSHLHLSFESLLNYLSFESLLNYGLLNHLSFESLLNYGLLNHLSFESLLNYGLPIHWNGYLMSCSGDCKKYSCDLSCLGG
jgi:hypothetical protein